MPKLENWTLIVRTDLYGDTYQRLIGDVYSHPRANKKISKLCNGSNIMTSKLVSIDLKNGVAITQSGTEYELGTRSDVESL